MFPAQDDEAELQSEAQNISREFQTLRDDVIAQYGYERFRSRRAAAAATASGTQELFTSRTRMQCDSESHDNILERRRKNETGSPHRVRACVPDVVDEGVRRCTDWFSLRWAECMKAIPVPVINHILCVPMQFHFLCDVMRGERSRRLLFRLLFSATCLRVTSQSNSSPPPGGGLSCDGDRQTPVSHDTHCLLLLPPPQ